MKKLNLGSLQSKIDSGKQKPDANKTPENKKSVFLDTKQNIDWHVRQAFLNLPGVPEAKQQYFAETEHLPVHFSKDDEKIWDKSYGKYLKTADEIRKNNSKLLADSIIKNVPNAINNQKGNQEYLRCFNAWLRKIRNEFERKDKRRMSDDEFNHRAFDFLRRSFGKKLATHINPDLDGLACEHILKICEFTPWETRRETIAHKEIKKGYLNVDVSGENGAYIDLHRDEQNTSFLGSFFNATVALDHHSSKIIDGEVYHGASSAAQMVHAMLKTMNKVPQKYAAQIERFVNFVNTIDSAGFEVVGRDFDYSHKTLMGLQKLLLKNPRNIAFVYNYFANPNNRGLEILTDEYLKNTLVFDMSGKQVPLKTLSDSKMKANKEGVKTANDLLDAGMSLYSPLNHEGFIVDLHSKLVNPAEVANYLGYGLIKVQNDGKIYIYSPRHMDFDEKTWRTFGDYTRGHILFIDVTKISDWSRFEKVLFDRTENKEVLDMLRTRINRKRQDIKVKKQEIAQMAVVKDISHGAINKFVANKPAMKLSEILPGKEYDVVINNMDKRGVFVTFAKNADKSNVTGPLGNINGLIHKSQLVDDAKVAYYATKKHGQDIIRVRVQSVLINEDGTYRINLEPATQAVNVDTSGETKTA